MTHVTGLELKSYINSGTHATPTWGLVERIANESLQFAKDRKQIMNRASIWKLGKSLFLALSGSFVYHEIKNAADADFDTIYDSFLNNTIFEMAFMDGAIATSGNKGFRAGVEIVNLQQKRDLEDVREWTCNFELSEFIESGSLVEPDRYVVA